MGRVWASEQAFFARCGVRLGAWETRTSQTVGSRVFYVPELEVFAHARLDCILPPVVPAGGVGPLGQLRA